MKHSRMPTLMYTCLTVLMLLALVFPAQSTVSAVTTLSVTPISWNVIGLDSNNVNVGPNTFPVGVRVTNTGSAAAANVTATLIWDTANAYINARPGTSTTLTAASLAPGAFTDFYFEVEVTRNASAYDTTRRFHISISADGGASTASTPVRELYVEHLISQNRNSTTNVQYGTSLSSLTTVPNGGSLVLLKDQNYYIRLNASTATQGYEQIESFLNLPNTIFQVLSVDTTYSAESSDTMNPPYDRLYGDACVWDSDPNSPNYRSCLSTGKAGGTMQITYQVKIIAVPSAPLVNPEPISPLTYDFSGSSYHYNSDIGASTVFAEIIDPTNPPINFSKAFSPSTIPVNGVSTLSLTIANTSAVAFTGLSFTDSLPGTMKVANPTGASTFGCGSPTFAPAVNDTMLTFSNGSLAPNGTCVIKVNVTASAVSTLTNTTSALSINGMVTGKTASAVLTVNNAPAPPACTPNLALARWTMEPSQGASVPPAYSYKSPRVTTATTSYVGTGTSAISTSNGFPVNSWAVNGGWAANNIGYPQSGAPYFQFTVDTSKFANVNIQYSFQIQGNWANSRNNYLYVYSSADGGTYSTIQTVTNFKKNDPWKTANVNAASTGSSTTSFRINAVGQQQSDALLALDNIYITGCGVPDYPTLTKAFSPNPIAVNGTSTLTFTLSNYNNVALTGATFTDALPAGVRVAATPAASTTCAGATWAPAAGATTLTFSGGTIPALVPPSTTPGTCTASVNVTATTAGPHNNVSGYISTTQTGQNATATGSASANLTAVAAPSIAKVFYPDTIAAGSTATLTFTISNPNLNDALGSVAFSDNYPANLVNAAAPSVSNSCGGAVTAVAGAGSISLSGGSLAAGASCAVSVKVTSSTAATYNNTSNAVTAVVNGSTITGNTASDSLIVTPVHPGLALQKQVGTSAAGPWYTAIAVTAGSNVYYKFTVENTGDVVLTGVNVTDPNINTSSCSFTSSLPVAVAANENHITTCVVGPVSAAAGSHLNTATAHGTNNSVTYNSNTDTAIYNTTGLTLVKTAVEKYFTAAGELLHYTYLVTNSGYASLKAPVTVTDNKVSVSCPQVSSVGDSDDWFDAGESLTCTSSAYTVSSADVTAGSVTNSATASADGVNSSPASQTVPLAQADFGNLPAAYASLNLYNQNGARHLLGSTYLGSAVAPETDGTNNGTGDTFQSAADDDGVTWTPNVKWVPGDSGAGKGGSIDVTVTCPSGTCYLYGWVDWGMNNNFTDYGEQIIGQPVTAGLHTIRFDIPLYTSNPLNGTFYARFRLYAEDPGVTAAPGGQALNSAGSAATVGEVEDYMFEVVDGVVTPVTLSYFTTQSKGTAVIFNWSTATETGNIGFNLYVENNGKVKKVNKSLIPSKNVDSLNRLDYTYQTVVKGDRFYIEDVSVQGATKLHGPFQLGQSYGDKTAIQPINWAAIQAEHSQAFARQQEALKPELVVKHSSSSSETDQTASPESAAMAASPNAVLQMKVNQTGIYRVTYEMLRDAGYDLSGAPATSLTLYNRGKLVVSYVGGPKAFGPGSYIEFYGEALDTVYTDTNIYTLVGKATAGSRVAVNTKTPASTVKPPASFTETLKINRQNAFADYTPAEDTWYETEMLVFKTAKSWNSNFTVSGLANTSSPTTLNLEVWGITDWDQSPDHHLKVKVNGVQVADEIFDGWVVKTLKLTLPAGTLKEGVNTLTLTLPGDTGVDWDMITLDKYSITYPRSFKAQDGKLTFTAAASAFKVTNLPSKDVAVYRKAATGLTRLTPVVIQAADGSYTATFLGDSRNNSTYFVSAASALNKAQFAAVRAQPDLSQPAQFLIISHPDFIEGLQPLVEARRAQGYTVSVVDVTDLYTQYTYGIFDPAAIKQHIAYAAQNLGTQYVLLVGGDTYDYRDYLKAGSISFIPSLYTSTSADVRFVAVDPLYADVNGDNLPDLAIGRFPVRTSEELAMMVDKTLAYAGKDYGRTAMFSADERDGVLSFKLMNDQLAAALPADWAVEKVSLDDQALPEAQVRLTDAMNRGTALVSYTGHSGPDVWSYNGLFDITDAAALTNAGRPFVAVQWGCWNNYYIDPFNEYLVQSFLFSGDQGAAAVIGASTLVDAFNENALGQLLTPRLAASGLPLGQAIQDAKAELAQTHPEYLDVLLGWNLMGDPTLTIEP